MRESSLPLRPTSPTFGARLICTQAQALALSEQVLELFDPEETVIVASELSEKSEKIKDRDWLFEIYFLTPPQEEEVRALLESLLDEALHAHIHFFSLQTRDWVATSLEGLKPVEVGRILLHGQHDRDARRPHHRALEIEAALAFGTGHHGTTQGCLALFQRVLKKSRLHSVLDIGTGTGVLALAAAQLVKGARITASDIDPLAIHVARLNARLNGVHSAIRFVTASGLQHPLLRAQAPYDLIFANILAAPLCRLAGPISDICHKDTSLILSGLLPQDVHRVLSFYQAWGFRLKARQDIENWASLLLSQ